MVWSLALGPVASQGRSCFKDSPPAGHKAGFKTSFAFLYCHTPTEWHPQASQHFQHTSNNPYALFPEVPPHYTPSSYTNNPVQYTQLPQPRGYERRASIVRCGFWRRVPGEGSTYCLHTVEPRLHRVLPFESPGRAPASFGRIAHEGTA